MKGQGNTETSRALQIANLSNQGTFDVAVLHFILSQKIVDKLLADVKPSCQFSLTYTHLVVGSFNQPSSRSLILFLCWLTTSFFSFGCFPTQTLPKQKKYFFKI